MKQLLLTSEETLRLTRSTYWNTHKMPLLNDESNYNSQPLVRQFYLVALEDVIFTVFETNDLLELVIEKCTDLYW